MRRLSSVFLLLSALCWLTLSMSCGGETIIYVTADTETAQPDATFPTRGDDRSTPDAQASSVEDVAAPSTDATSAEADTSIDEQDPIQPDAESPSPESDVAPLEDAESEGPAPGTFGAPCTLAEDCFSGWCIMGLEGQMCTVNCDSSCPEGYDCVPLSGGSDIEYVCTPLYAKLCQPCNEHVDCQPLVGEGTDLCLSYGDAGSFCGADCQDGVCPDGYDCVVEQAGDGSSVKQCRRVDGAEACECTALSTYLSLSTECQASSSAGSCSGLRTCEASGLGPCNAATPAAEACDGVDNDCNGITDDIGVIECAIETVHGVCFGEMSCTGGIETCVGQAPEAEVCDGVDNNCNGFVDEGSTDTDQDGLANCVDPDDDNDGYDDVIDNCPLQSNPDQANLDADTQGDACDADDDGDGSPDQLDCQPLNPNIYPFAPEVCDGADNDCDGAVDEATCGDNNPCTDDICDPILGCQNLSNSAGCNDGNACTENDHCSFGACSGTFITCDDGDPCTSDSCTESGCQHSPTSGSCDDGNPCTANDVCQGGLCVGQDVGCECSTDADCVGFEDGDLCNGTLRCDTGSFPAKCVVDTATIIQCELPESAHPTCSSPSCDPTTGACSVIAVAQGQLCDDDDLCTVDETCQAGACVGSDLACGDSNPCTTHSCDPEAGCVASYNTAPCDDQNPCTLSDTCQGGACVGGGQLPCDDGNPCTNDYCEPGQGCATVFNTNPCDDGNPCTTEDTCQAGSCIGGPALTCNDGNPCTYDSCSVTGCAYTPIAGPCDDGDACTSGDACVSGTCTGGPALDCDDNNPCTDDQCFGGVCTNTAASGTPCDDGDPCTIGDTCLAGSCMGQGNEGCCQSNAECDDGNPCTLDICEGNGLCSHAVEPLNGVACNADFSGCTAGDICTDGSCVAGAQVDCSASADACNNAVCTSTGIHSYLCEKTPKGPGLPCDDGQFCTINDVCGADGVCAGPDLLDCSEFSGGCVAGTCNEALDQCDGDPVPDGTSCNADDSGCTVGDSCLAGTCVPGDLANCAAFGSQCAVYSCQASDAENFTCVPNNVAAGTACDDGLFCTTNDQCNGNGICLSGEPNPCSAGTDACNDALCDEVTDTCTPTPKADGTSCSDGDACTTVDTCQGGQCIGSELVCGEFKISTFQTSEDEQMGIAGYGDGRYMVTWPSSDNRRQYARSYTGTWSREWTEFEQLADLGYNDANWNTSGVDSAQYGESGIATVGWRRGTKSPYCWGNCGGWCGDDDWRRGRRENVTLTWRGTDGVSLGSVTLYQRSDETNHYNTCSVAAFSPSADDLTRVAHVGSAGIVAGWEQDGQIDFKVYDEDRSQIAHATDQGEAGNGFSIAGFPDGRFVIARSEGGDIKAQMYTSSGTEDGSEITVNTTTTGTQDWPDVATLDSGRFAIVWRSTHNGNSDIYAQAFKAGGDKLGIEINVHGANAHEDIRPSVSFVQDAGNMLVVWQAPDADGQGIFGRWFDKNGFSQGDVFQVNLTASGNQTWPNQAGLSSDEAVVVWRDSDGHIMGRKFSPDNVPLEAEKERVLSAETEGGQAVTDAVSTDGAKVVTVWEETASDGNVEVLGRVWDAAEESAEVPFQVNVTTDYWQLNPSIAVDGVGNMIVAWDSFGQDGDVEGVYLRGFDAMGTPLTEEIQANSTTDNEQQRPVVARDPNGTFMVAWESFLQPGGASYDIIARCFTSDGTAVVPEIMVNTYTDSQQQGVDVAWVPSPARYVVTWQSYGEDGDSWGVYAQTLNSTCAPLGAPFLVNTHTSGEQSKPVVASDANGRYAIVWQSLDQDGSSYGIYAQRYNSDGSPNGDEFRVNDVTAQGQSTPSLAFLSDASMLVGWSTLGEDEEGSAVKYQRFSADGEKDGLAFHGNVYTASDQDNSIIAPLSSGGYAIMWTSNGQDGDVGSSIGRFFTP